MSSITIKNVHLRRFVERRPFVKRLWLAWRAGVPPSDVIPEAVEFLSLEPPTPEAIAAAMKWADEVAP